MSETWSFHPGNSYVSGRDRHGKGNGNIELNTKYDISTEEKLHLWDSGKFHRECDVIQRHDKWWRIFR